MIAQKQRTLAVKASRDSTYRFHNLYDLLHWDKWIHCAAQKVLARPGSDTAGVDGKTRDYFKKTYDHQIETIRQHLKGRSFKPQPVRRTHIPKADGRKRSLGIPALRDRIVQEALRMILDPIYESDFQAYSFGFRKGRCTMDAIAVLMPLFNRSLKYYYVIEGGLKSYFDTVNHRKLLSLLKRRIADRKLIDLLWKFLKAGVMEGSLFAKTEAGVPQGGIISPLLANLYLNEFDKWAEERWHRRDPSQRQKVRRDGGGNYVMVRYADDFVVATNDTIAGARRAKAEIKAFLEEELHLTLSETKTKITHVNDGFDFLGFHIQRRKPEGRWVVHLRPSRESIKRIKAKLKEMTSSRMVLFDEVTRLSTLNTVVRGWCAYYRHTSLQDDLEQISRYAWHRYHKWLLRKHKGSRKQQLIKQKTKVIKGRTRWYAEMNVGGNTVFVYQWLPSPQELKRSRYNQRGRSGFPHPYRFSDEPTDYEDPKGYRGIPEEVYRPRVGGDGRHGDPATWVQLRWKVKIRDEFSCRRCGGRTDLHVHGLKGRKSKTMADYATICRRCHHRAHGMTNRV